MSTIIDFTAARAARDVEYAAHVGYVESAWAATRPYSSFDDLPDVTIRGRDLIRAHIGAVV